MRRAILIWLALLVPLAVLGGDRGTYGGGTYAGGTYGGGSYGPPSRGGGVWNGFDYVVVLTADDGWKANRPWSALADSMSFPYTLALTGGAIGDADTSSHLSIDDMAVISTRPVEVISTGQTQNLSWGILRWDELAGNYPDSVRTDIARDWIWTWSGIDFAPRTFITDIGPMSYDVAAVQRDSGYIATRGIFHDNNAGGYKPEAPGADRWDKVLPYSRSRGGNIYGIASFRGQHASDPTQAVFGTDAEDNQTTLDSLSVRIPRLLYEVSDANEAAPIVVVLHGLEVTTDMLRQFIVQVRARGDTWITDFAGLADFIRGNHVAVDPPGSAPFAQLEGLTASDEIFWGPSPTVYTCTQDSFIFHNSNTGAPTTLKTEYTGGPFATALINPATPTVVGTLTGNLDGAVGLMPLAGSYKMPIMAFNIDQMDGKEVVSARLHYNGALGTDVSGVETSYFGVIGVTDPAVQAGSIASDMSYNYQDVSTTTSWGTSDGTLGSVDYLTDFGRYIHPDNNLANMSNTFVSIDCTDYIRRVVGDDLTSAMFLFYGNDETPTTLYRVRGSDNSTATNRPYLIISTCQ